MDEDLRQDRQGRCARRDHSSQEWGVSTQKGKTVYLHILDWKSRMLSLPLTEKVKSVVAYDTRRPIPFQQTKLGLTLSFDKAPSEANAIDYIVEVTLH